MGDLTGTASVFVREGWHYVGEAGEPAFLGTWANYGSGFSGMAYRLREAGVVDLVGVVTHSTATGTIFTLPAGYRPLTGIACTMPANTLISGTFGVDMIQISDSGAVSTVNGSGAGSTVFIAGSFFLTPPL